MGEKNKFEDYHFKMNAMGALCFVLLTIYAVHKSEALDCLPCDMRGIDWDATCPDLPDDCEQYTPLCKCCFQCAGKEGEKCDTKNPQCEGDLVAIMVKVGQFQKFSGICSIL